ncbi:MAG: hypothetical protein AB2689_02140 [Candidatus Thiodiazotropha taylori]
MAIYSSGFVFITNVPDDVKNEFGYGDVYTWTAIDADTKLIPEEPPKKRGPYKKKPRKD